MDSDITNEDSRSTRSVISVIGLIVVVIGMIASVQVENSFVPPAMIILGTIIILIAEKTRLDDRLN